jgi:hypothetical protein
MVHAQKGKLSRHAGCRRERSVRNCSFVSRNKINNVQADCVFRIRSAKRFPSPHFCRRAAQTGQVVEVTKEEEGLCVIS